MLTLRGCIELCDVTEDEIAAVAEHERIPMICAAELADYMAHSPDGVLMLKRMILDDIEARRGPRGLGALAEVAPHLVSFHPEPTRFPAGQRGLGRA